MKKIGECHDLKLGSRKLNIVILHELSWLETRFLEVSLFWNDGPLTHEEVGLAHNNNSKQMS